MLHVELIAAKHKFVSELKEEYRDTQIRPCIVRPSGFYSDLEEVLQMAISGNIFVFEDANELVSPIWGGDLALAIFDAFETEQEDINIGGPETLSFMEVADIAKKVVEEEYANQKNVAIWRVPRWIADAGVFLMTKTTTQKIYGPIHFISEASKHDMSASNFGEKK